MDKPTRVYVSYIASSPDKVWDLLTNAHSSPDWFFGNRMEVGAEVGDSFRLTGPDGALDVDGKILAKDAWLRLRVSWVMPDMPVLSSENEVEFLIEDKGNDVVRLAVQEYHYVAVPERWVEAGREGWSYLLAGIKTMLETGAPIPRIEMKPPEQD
jgi:uncharacterized protein YndB with AHSA1/START domain